jgi:hypothetical protein
VSLHELNGKRDATIVRRPAQTLVDMPRPVGVVTIRKSTKAAVLRELKRMQGKGLVYSAGPLAEFHRRAGGGWGVKVALAKPLPEPMPGWAKGLIAVGATLVVCSGVSLLVLRAMADTFRAAAGVPWGVVGATLVGAAVSVVVVLAVIRRLLGGGGVHISQNIHL